MKWLERFKQVNAASTERADSNITYAQGDMVVAPATLLKPKKWVTWQNRTGILHQFVGFTHAEVHFVDGSTGATIQVQKLPLSELRFAFFNEIPECRRIGITHQQAVARGYA